MEHCPGGGGSWGLSMAKEPDCGRRDQSQGLLAQNSRVQVLDFLPAWKGAALPWQELSCGLGALGGSQLLLEGRQEPAGPLLGRSDLASRATG